MQALWKFPQLTVTFPSLDQRPARHARAAANDSLPMYGVSREHPARDALWRQDLSRCQGCEATPGQGETSDNAACERIMGVDVGGGGWGRGGGKKGGGGGGIEKSQWRIEFAGDGI